MTTKKDTGGQGDYVLRVREETRRYVQELLSENEKLRRLAAALESEKGRLVAEKMALQEKLLALREELDRVHHDQAELRRQLAQVEAENQQFSHQYVEVEQQNNNLANLYVASYQLHSTLDREEVVAAIQEIVINLIGSEELAIYELAADGAALRLVGSFGIDPVGYATVPLSSGIIGRVALSGEAFLPGQAFQPPAAPAPREASLTACVPLKLGDKVLGALAVFRLLSHKSGLEAIDYELFNLLATHAATALYLTHLHRESTAGVAK
jgi:GAF domain-containing protein